MPDTFAVRGWKRPALLAATTAIYLIAAWMVAPGFYDGFGPIQPYNWVSPPPQAPPGNLPPQSGHATIDVVGAVTDAGSAFTDDGQIVIGFLPGAFDAAGKTSVSVDIKPESTFPNHTGLQFVTNVYLATADAPVVMESNLVMVYSNVLPAPSLIYFAADANGPWRSIGGSESAPYTIQTKSRQLGYFAAGYSASATSGSSSGTSQLLPIAVAVLILGVLVAGIPLAMVRRRRAAGDDEQSDEDDEAEPPATPRT